MAIRRNLSIPLSESKFDSKDEKKAKKAAKKALRTAVSVGRPERVAKKEISKYQRKKNFSKKDRETNTYEHRGKYFKVYEDGQHGSITKETYDKIRRAAITIKKQKLLKKK